MLFCYFLLALLPILWLIVAMSILKLQAYIAALSAMAIAFVEAMVFWHASFLSATTSVAEGVVMACWPIVLVIIAAIFVYNMTVHTGAMDVIKRQLTSVSDDRRVLAILIAWCFGGFMEGMAGYGTAIAIPASMMFALGFNPVEAILMCLVADSYTTMFGAVGVPTQMVADLTALDATVVSHAQILQAAVFMLLCPFVIVTIAGHGFKGLKGMVPFTLVAGVSFLVPEYIAAKFMGPTLPVIVGAVFSLVCSFAFGMWQNKRKATPEEFVIRVEGAAQKKPADPDDTYEDVSSVDTGLKTTFVAWSPFLFILAILLLVSIPAIGEPLGSIKTAFHIYRNPDADPVYYTIKWLNTPGVLVFLAGILGAIVQKVKVGDFFKVLRATVKQMSKTIITMMGVLACAKLMSYSGMTNTIAEFFVETLGKYFPLVAPLIGAIGAFVTGSGTSTGALFGSIQKTAALNIGASPEWMVAANSVGVSAGKMIAPQSIAIGSAACDLTGHESELMKKAAVYAAGFIVLMAVITQFGQPLWAAVQ